MNIKHLMATVAVAVLAGTATAENIIVFENPPDFSDHGGYASMYQPCGYDYLSAENFTLDADCSLAEVHWYGFSEAWVYNDYTNMLGWTIALYEDAGGVPGATIYEEYFEKDATHVTWADDFIPGSDAPDAWSQWVTLSSLVDVQADTQYWCSIGAHLDVWYNDQWFLNNAFGDDHSAGYSWTDEAWNARGGNSAMSLYAVPTPASLALLLMGPAVIRRRRR